MLFDLKSAIKSNTWFKCYGSGNLWYTVSDSNGVAIDFPVPIEDTGNAIFLAQAKGIFFMRWIRQHLETIRTGSLAK